jgi:hypothetical protein
MCTGLRNSVSIIMLIILSKLSLYIDGITGFQHNRSATDQIFCIRQILEEKWEYNDTAHQLFIDFKKAYDSIWRVSRMHRDIKIANISF